MIKLSEVCYSLRYKDALDRLFRSEANCYLCVELVKNYNFLAAIERNSLSRLHVKIFLKILNFFVFLHI